MIVKDFSTFMDEHGEIPLTERMRSTFKYGSSWYTDIQSQELVIERLQNALDDDFILLRNFNLPGLEVPIPITLVGPAGVQVIYTSSIKGIYQAKGESWGTMSGGARRFKESKPNLVNRCLLLAQAVQRHLERFDYGQTSIDAVNMFTDPGIHVDTKSPATRIVMIDALDRYIAKLPLSSNPMSVDMIQKVVDVLIDPPVPEFDSDFAMEGGELEAAFASPSSTAGSKVTEVRIPGGRSVRFSTRQWLMLGGLLLVNFIVLFLLLLIVLFYV